MKHSLLCADLIVLADDDKDHGFLFKGVLKDVDPGKKLIQIHDGCMLIEMISDLMPEWLFLDLKMPCKQGFDCLKEIKASKMLKDIKVIVYSSSSSMNDIQKAYAHDADLYMVKPYSGDHLRHAFGTIFSMKWNGNEVNRHYFINNKFVLFTS